MRIFQAVFLTLAVAGYAVLVFAVLWQLVRETLPHYSSHDGNATALPPDSGASSPTDSGNEKLVPSTTDAIKAVSPIRH